MRFFRNTEFNQQKNKVSGYACVFEKESVTLSDPYNGSYRRYIEIIHKGAITQETINNSDIFATLDHDTGYIVARSRNGNGSLHLSVDDKGLYFEFELPKTEKGNEIRSYIERGEINQCSFCFEMDIKDKTAQRWSIKDGSEYREIFKIKKLFDIALVFQPAYPDSSVSLRKAMEEEKEYISEQINMLNEQRNMTPEEKQEQENNLKEIETLKSEVKELKEELLESEMQELEQKLDEKPAENEEKQEEKSTEMEEKPEEKEDEKESETVEDTPKEDEKQDENPEKQDDSEDEKEKVEKKSLDKQINIKNKRDIYMKQENFLLKEIRSAIETGNRTFSFPAVNEYRTVTVNDQAGDPVVAGVHDNIVETELQGILEPLYADSILFNLGCRMYKGLPMGDISIPKMSKTSVGWASEIAAATATGVTFENVKLSPKRITAYIDISKMLIAQDSLNSEDAIRRDIVNALNSKLQQTFFGVENKTDDKPIGLFYGQTLEEVEDFAGIADLEAEVDDENVKGERKYVGSNHCKAAFRVMPKSALTNELMMNAGEIDGTPFIATSDIADKKFIYGDFSSIAIGSWGNVELSVDTGGQVAINGCIRLIVNAYFDWAIVRPEGLKFGKIKED